MYASNRPTLGRRMLMTDEREITKDNIISVVSKAFMEHQENVAQEVFLFEYEKGNQPILNREKKIRPDLNATVVENNASKIVDVHLGYCFSNPITFVQRAKIEPTKKQKKALFGFLRKKDEDDGENIDDLKIAMLNKMMQEQSKAAKDIALGRNLFICGVGYQMMLPNRNKSRYSPFELWVDSKPIIDGIQKKLASKEEKTQQPNPNAYKDEEGNGGENNKEKDKTEESKQPSKTAMVEE